MHPHLRYQSHKALGSKDITLSSAKLYLAYCVVVQIAMIKAKGPKILQKRVLCLICSVFSSLWRTTVTLLSKDIVQIKVF
jgi:hypothetical protein